MQRSAVYGIAAALLGAAASPLAAQVGVAVRLEAGAPVSLGFPILASNGRFMIEPTIRFDHSESKGSETPNAAGPGAPATSNGRATEVTIGGGLFLRSRSQVVLYGGPRASFGLTSERSSSSNGSPATNTFTQDGWLTTTRVGIVLGLDTRLAGALRFGAEIRWTSETIEGDVDVSTTSPGGSLQYTVDRRNERTFADAAFVIRWYPGGR